MVLALVILGFIVLLRSPGFESLAIMKEFSSRQDRFYLELLRSLNLTLMPLIAAALIGCPLGLAAYRSPRFGKAALSFAATAQTIPSLALFGILIAPLAYLSRSFPFLRELGIKGIGSAPAFIALFLYALLPIVRNTYLGFKENSLAVLESGRGMGMGAWELFQGVELPLAAPLAMRGIRTAAVQTAGTSAVAALIGAGGLGSFIFQGLGQAASDLVLLGVLPLLALALLLDRVFAIFERLATPRILRGNSQ
ncbi:hypothetical protein MASR2M78_35900 [Treponema sp.]